MTTCLGMSWYQL